MKKKKKPSPQEFKIKVYPGDTDSYGVVWHGAYLKWLERGRIDVLEQMGIMFKKLDEMGILMPVTEINLRYKHFARPYDELLITSSVEEFGKTHVTFYQEIKNSKTGELILHARVTGVTTNREGRLYRTIPDYLRERYDEILNNHSM